jgi:hypothetical protein
MLVLLTE